MAFPSGWTRRVKLTVDKTYIPSDRTDFPVCLVWTGAAGTSDLPQEMMDADGAHPCLNGGGDVRFSTDAAGTTRLPCEIVKCVTNNNPALALAEIHVKLPSISSAANTDFYLWYGKAAETQPAVSDAYGRNATWSRYKLVYHCPETSGGDCFDSHGVKDGSFVGDLPNNTTGLLGVNSAQSLLPLTSSEDEIKIESQNPSASAITLIFIGKWAKTGSPTNPRMSERSADGSLRMRINTTSDTVEAQFKAGGSTASCTSTGAVTDNQYYLEAGKYDGSNIGVVRMDGSANDGLVGALAKTGTLDTNAGDFAFGGRGGTTGSNFPGEVEEFRWSDTCFSTDESASIWHNFNVPESFVIVGTPETPNLRVFDFSPYMAKVMSGAL